MATRTLDADDRENAGTRWAIGTAGTFSVADAAGRDVTPRGRKARALVAYLVGQAGARVPREKLMDLLWGDRGEPQARASLRQALLEIRQSTGDLISTDRGLVWIDFDRLDLLRPGEGEGEAFADLNGVSPDFDEWLRGERERRAGETWNLLREEVEQMLARGRGAAAIPLIDRMQRLDPYNEDWLRLAMQAEFQAGRPAAIDQRFRELKDVLARELGVSPAAETRALRDRLVVALSETPAPLTGRGPDHQPAASDTPRRSKARGAALFAALILAIAVAAVGWMLFGQRELPVVAVGPADSSSRAQSLSRDLFVKLGTLAQVGSGRWELIDAATARARPDLLFRTAERQAAGQPQTNLTLLNGRDESLLWAAEFSFPADHDADLRQRLALTAGRVLQCALEARHNGGLPPDLLRLFLTGCAELAETGWENPDTAQAIMRTITARRPRFAPAWGALLSSDSNVFQLTEIGSSEWIQARDTLQRDIAAARRIAPDLPEIRIAQLDLLPPQSYGYALDLVVSLRARAHEKPEVWVEDSLALSRVGRMAEAIVSARRASELNPLSPAISRHLIRMLAWGNRIEAARRELQRAERLWAGTGALRDAQYAFHLRFGDPNVALALKKPGDHPDPYLQARIDPSPANVEALVQLIDQHELPQTAEHIGYVVQALGEFNRTEAVYEWLEGNPPDAVASISYILFRPALDDVRRDARFMRVAKRIGLLDYWRKSGEWPDFCRTGHLPYDCRQEAAKLGA